MNNQKLNEVQKPALKQANVSGWKELDLVQPTIGQKIVYEGNLFPADGIYVGEDWVSLTDGTKDKFDRWKSACH